MPGRILNFSEFFDKYSKDSGNTGKSLDDFTNSAANFEEGFDKETYDQTQIGPNRPVSGGIDVTPPQPGEEGAPKFSTNVDIDMSAPEGEEIPEEENVEEIPEEETEETPEEEKEEMEETPEPEAGANPKKEKIEESLVKGFTQFIKESYFEMDGFSSGEEKYDPFKEDEEDDDSKFYDKEESCSTCGDPIDYTEFGSSCGCNM